ncbi:MAG: PKD domain-containing protein, partial [Bacteroidota bacterium]
TRTFQFKDTSNGTVLAWELDFGDGTPSKYGNTSGWTEYHTFPRQGNFPVKLDVWNGINSGTADQRVFVL